MKFTLAVTQQCNLECSYCYISKKDAVMSLDTADAIVSFAFNRNPANEDIEVGFFGGEPLLEFELIKKIIKRIQSHEAYNPNQVKLSLVTNGTVFSDSIASDLITYNISPGISIDGPPAIQDAMRVFPDGNGTSSIIEKNLDRALDYFPLLPVNAVYSPENLNHLPKVVDYLVSLGVRNIYLNPNITASWQKTDADILGDIYQNIGHRYLDLYKSGNPCRISLIDNKIVVILRGGYAPLERCRMGKGEYAFAPSGNVYPCERLIGNDDGGEHCLGNINDGPALLKTCHHDPNNVSNEECQSCSLIDYCMHWCGCTNYFSSGRYNTVNPFICASEKASLEVALTIIKKLGEEGIPLAHHLDGTPLMNIISEMCSTSPDH